MLRDKNIAKKIGLLCLLTSICFVLSACGSKKENDTNSSNTNNVEEKATKTIINGKELVETENFTNIDYVQIKQDSVFYDSMLLNVLPSVALAAPKTTTQNKNSLSYQDDCFEYYLTVYTGVFDVFDEDTDLNAIMSNKVTSMDDENAIYTRYLFETMYYMSLQYIGVEDSLAYKRDFYTSNNVDYFTIKEIQYSPTNKADVIFLMEDDNVCVIVLKYDFTNEKSMQEREDFIDTFMATKYIKYPETYKTELFLWRVAPETITITK